MSLSLNQAAPDFSLPADNGKTWTLSALRGQRVVIVFYPGDDTPVCTAQLCEYRDGVDEFEGLNAVVIGISQQDAASHQAFKKKRALPFTLLTDADLKVAASYGAKGILGMKRACFLVDENGLLRYQHVELTALFRRTRAELVQALAAMG
ncbi:peroxiredoxin [bacterium]|nr:peroxiredoxin [bacterium]